MALREELWPWDNQPTAVAQVRQYPGLKNFWNFGDRSGRCLVTGARIVVPSNPAAMTWLLGGVRLQMLTYSIAGAQLPLAVHVVAPITILVGALRLSGSGVAWSVMNPLWDGWYAGSNEGISSNNSDFSGSVVPTVGARLNTHVSYQAYTTSGVNDLRGSINGGPVALDSTLATPTPTNPNSTFRLGSDSAGTNRADVLVSHVAIINRAVSDDELRALSLNPWGRLLEPRSIWVPVTAGGGGAQTVAIGQATETDTAQAFAAVVNVIAAIGQASEADTAQALASAQSQAIGQAAETDSAQAFAGAQAAAIAQAAETDLAQPLQANQAASIGQAQETDVAQAVTYSAPGAIAQAQETDEAQPLQANQALTIGQATETDFAQALTYVSGTAIGMALEIDTAGAFSAQQAAAIGQASETDLAQALTVGTAGGTASAAEVWGYTLSNGLTAEQNMVAIHAFLSDLHLIHGLTLGSPLSVSQTARAAGAVSQAVAQVGDTVTVTRQ